MTRTALLLLALSACTRDPSPPVTEAPAPVPVVAAAPIEEPTAEAPSEGSSEALLAFIDGMEDGETAFIEENDENTGFIGGAGEVHGLGGRGVRSLSACFPPELGGIAIMTAALPPGFRADPFARAYLERRSGGRSININVWDAAISNLEGQLGSFPVLGDVRGRRDGSGIERVGGRHEGHPSESDWEELASGHRDSFTVRVSETRLVSLRVEPNATRGEAADLFTQLDLDCLIHASLD